MGSNSHHEAPWVAWASSSPSPTYFTRVLWGYSGRRKVVYKCRQQITEILKQSPTAWEKSASLAYSVLQFTGCFISFFKFEWWISPWRPCQKVIWTLHIQDVTAVLSVFGLETEAGTGRSVRRSLAIWVYYIDFHIDCGWGWSKSRPQDWPFQPLAVFEAPSLPCTKSPQLFHQLSKLYSPA